MESPGERRAGQVGSIHLGVAAGRDRRGGRDTGLARPLRVGLIGVGVVAAVSWAAWSWLTAGEMPPAVSDFVLDVSAMRDLADSLPGPKPLEVRSELVATASLPRGAVFAGEKLVPHAMAHQVFQVVGPTGALLVDSAFDRAMQAELPGAPSFSSAAYGRVQRALEEAELILVTHEHRDHLDGIARHASPESLLGRLLLTREQLSNESSMDQVDLPLVLRRGLEPLDYAGMLAIAPGVVLVKAPGHTPGSQLVYVRLADERELLLLGDVVWHLDALRNLHYRPRLITMFFIGEDRGAVLQQMRTLHDLMASHPEIRLVPTHDMDQRTALVASGLLVEGLRVAEP